MNAAVRRAAFLLSVVALVLMPGRMAAQVAAAGAQQTGGPAADMGAINNALAELLKTFQERNIAGLTGIMANELQAYGTTFNANGLPEWRTKAAPTLSPIRGVKVVGRQDVTMSGNLAFVAFMTDVQREGASGPATDRLRWTVVFQKSNNRWVIVHYHASPDPAGII